MTLLIGLAIRSSVMLAAGLLLSASLSKRSAALRHRVLAAALLGAVLVVPASLALPEWSVTVPAPAAASSATSAVIDARFLSATPATDTPAPPTPPDVSPVVLVWLAGVLIAFGTLIIGLARVHRVAAAASRVEDARWLAALDRVAARYGIRQRIMIKRTSVPDLLATWGARRPQVLLPAHAVDWTPDRIDVVLSHELAHIRRYDWLVQQGAESVRAILWFNPLAWMVCTRLRRESEQACDDEVLGTGADARDYAAHLLELVRQCRRPVSRWASVLPMAHPSTLEKRIAAMLNPRLERSVPSRRVMAMLGLAVLLLSLPVASLRARPVTQAPLSGTIYDATGAVVPGAQVTVVDANESTLTVTSNASGRFEFPVVAPGKYVLGVTLPGFRTLRQEFELRDAGDWDRAITLQVGDLRETVSVSESRLMASPPAPTAAAGPRRIRVGGNIRAPRKVLDVKPVYPAAMREAGLTGIVPIEAVIAQDGTVSLVRVLSAQVHPDFAIAAVDAVRQWRFTPTLLNGVAVDVVMTVSVRFDLKDE